MRSSRQYKFAILILFPVVILAAVMDYRIWSSDREAAAPRPAKHAIRAEHPSRARAAAAQTDPGPADAHAVNVIAEKNLFSPERKDFPLALPPPQAAQPTARPQVTLYGVILADTFQSASVSSPGHPVRKGERESRVLKVGDRIGDYKLAKISIDRITMEGHGDSFEVLLHDPKNPKQRTEVRTEVKSAEGKGLPAAIAAQPPAVPLQAEVAGRPAGPAQETAIKPVSPLPEPNSTSPVAARRMRRLFGVPPQQNTALPGGSPGNIGGAR